MGIETLVKRASTRARIILTVLGDMCHDEDLWTDEQLTEMTAESWDKVEMLKKDLKDYLAKKAYEKEQKAKRKYEQRQKDRYQC